MGKLPTIPRGHRLPEAERGRVGKELLKKYESGKSIREICTDTGYSIGRVRRLLIESGVEFRGRGGATRSRGK